MCLMIYRTGDNKGLARTGGAWGWSGLLLLLLLTACASSPDSGAPVEERQAPVSGQTPHSWPRTPAGTTAPGVLVRPLAAPAPAGDDSENPAVKHLVYRAERQARSGDYGLSAASLERALEIAPGDAWLWHRLARVRLAEGDLDQARLLARKSAALAGGNPRLLAENRKLQRVIDAKTGAGK